MLFIPFYLRRTYIHHGSPRCSCMQTAKQLIHGFTSCEKQLLSSPLHSQPPVPTLHSSFPQSHSIFSGQLPSLPQITPHCASDSPHFLVVHSMCPNPSDLPTAATSYLCVLYFVPVCVCVCVCLCVCQGREWR